MFLKELTRFFSPEPAGGGGNISVTVTPGGETKGADTPDDSVDTPDFGLSELESGAPNEELKEFTKVVREEQEKDPTLKPFEVDERDVLEEIEAGTKPEAKEEPKEQKSPDTQSELSDAELEQLKVLGKRAMAKHGKLNQYIPNGDIFEALTRYNGGLEMFERARALAGRAGMSIPQLFDYVEQGVTGAQEIQAGRKPANPEPKPKELDNETLEKLSNILGLTPEEGKSTIDLLRQSLGISSVDQTLTDRLARLEHGQNLTQEQQNQAFWSNEFSTFAKSNPKVESLKDKLDFILAQEEASSPGFCQRKLDESVATGVRPYQWALRYYMASYATPEEFMQSLGAVKPKSEAPVPAQRVVGAGHLGPSSSDNDNFDPEKATLSEASAFLSKALGNKVPIPGERFR